MKRKRDVIRSMSFVRYMALATIGILMALATGEGLVRLATMNQENYVIEMWRYAKLLKMKSPRSDIGHQHIPNRTATLQNVVIRINSLGMRGPEPNDAAPRNNFV